jgi:hypothetical protein
MTIKNLRCTPKVLAGLLALFAMPLFAQDGQILWSTFTAGFGASSSENSSVTSAVGQPFAGTSAGAADNVGSGFLVDPLLTGTITAVTDGRNDPKLPEVFELEQNYPNPFNPTTRIELSLPRTSEVRLAVYDLLGRQVITLLDGERSAGRYTVEWNGRDFSGRVVGSGIYFYVLEAGEFKQTRRLLLLK